MRAALTACTLSEATSERRRNRRNFSGGDPQPTKPRAAETCSCAAQRSKRRTDWPSHLRVTGLQNGLTPQRTSAHLPSASPHHAETSAPVSPCGTSERSKRPFGSATRAGARGARAERVERSRGMEGDSELGSSVASGCAPLGHSEGQTAWLLCVVTGGSADV